MLCYLYLLILVLRRCLLLLFNESDFQPVLQVFSVISTKCRVQVYRKKILLKIDLNLILLLHEFYLSGIQDKYQFIILRETF